MSTIRHIQFGKVHALVDAETGFLRRIHYDGVEVLRGVYAALRDHNWDTIEPQVHDLKILNHADRTSVSFTASCCKADVNYAWRGLIEVSAGGQLVYTFRGISYSTFPRNRIGFCVLHPPECAGLPCEVVSVDGRQSKLQFPECIAPHQPMLNMRSIRHAPTPALSVEVLMEGDTFEMEDQRNWTDASFKTYCTPLGDPFPVEVRAGETVEQKVTVTIHENCSESDMQSKPKQVAISAEVVALETLVDAQPTRLPKIGLGCHRDLQPLSSRHAELLTAVAPSHLRVDLDLSTADAIETLLKAGAQAQSLSSDLEIALLLTENAEDELMQVAKAACRLDCRIARWLVFHTLEKSTAARWVQLARTIFAEQNVAGSIFSGTNAFFAELNRERPQAVCLDGVCYSINPQYHAFDNASLMETASMQAETVRSTRAFLPGVPIAVSPVTLRPRFNPNATGTEVQPKPGELPSQVDPRQSTLFAAAWTLASLKYLCESNVESITFYETIGVKGIMEFESNLEYPKHFPSDEGQVFPLYHVLADVCELAGSEVIASGSSDILGAIALVLQSAKCKRTLIANLEQKSRSLSVTLPNGKWNVRRLNEQTLPEATMKPAEFRSRQSEVVECRSGKVTIMLCPYEVVTLDQQ